MKPLFTATTAADSSHLVWRVLTLVNLFRLLVAVLLTVFFDWRGRLRSGLGGEGHEH